VIGWWRRRRLAARAVELMPTRVEMAWLVRQWPCLARLDGDDRERLRRRTGEVLAAKQFSGAGGLAPDRGACLPVAAHAALPVLRLGMSALRGFQSFILYQDEFEVDVEEIDEHGLVHKSRDLRAGEAWHGGPVVLSLADVAKSGRGHGYHVVVHEIAHQLDSLNGEPDGFPPLPPSIEVGQWSEQFTRAYRQLNEALEHDRGGWLDEYAAESPAEFFAVTSEYFFDRPGELLRHEPGIYRLLALLYRQDPADHTSIASMPGARVN